MGSSRLEKFYAVCVVLILWAFLGSAMTYYFQRHDVSGVGLVNRMYGADLYPFKLDESISFESPKNTSNAYADMGGGYILT